MTFLSGFRLLGLSPSAVRRSWCYFGFDGTVKIHFDDRAGLQGQGYSHQQAILDLSDCIRGCHPDSSMT